MEQVLLEPIAVDQAPVLRNLFELYVYDFSEHVPLDLQPNGRFDVALGDRWWTSAEHFPFFIRWKEKLVGFALARRGSRVTGASEVMDVDQFFVIRGARGNKVGTTAAHALFDMFPGSWEIRVRSSNDSAMRFWSRALETRIGRPAASSPFSSEGVDWAVFRIESSRK